MGSIHREQTSGHLASAVEILTIISLTQHKVQHKIEYDMLVHYIHTVAIDDPPGGVLSNFNTGFLPALLTSHLLCPHPHFIILGNPSQVFTSEAAEVTQL